MTHPVLNIADIELQPRLALCRQGARRSTL
jgi:hypothetical protein